MKSKSFLTIEDVTKSEILNIFSKALEYKKLVTQGKSSTDLENKIMASLFFQPSTRTRAGFESAILRMGGKYISFSDICTTRSGDYYSESMYDMLQVLAKYTDIIVIRHNDNSVLNDIREIDNLRVINAGIGDYEHPVQALNFLFCLYLENRLDENASIGLIGDLGIRSLKAIVKAMNIFGIKKFYYLPPPNREIPKDISEFLNTYKMTYQVVNNTNEMVASVSNVLTIGINHPDHTIAISEPNGWIPTPKAYQITLETLKYARKGLSIYHPLPRTDEIVKSIDKTKYAKYFTACENCLYLNMALLYHVGLS